MCEFHGSYSNGFGDIWWTDNPIYFSSIDSKCKHDIITFCINVLVGISENLHYFDLHDGAKHNANIKVQKMNSYGLLYGNEVKVVIVDHVVDHPYATDVAVAV